MPKVKKTEPKTREETLLAEYDFGYRDGGFGQVRVWRRGWPSDCFQVMSQDEFEKFRADLATWSFFFLDFDKEGLD